MRKLYFLTIVMVSLSFISNAQISKGSTFLGGSVNMGTSSTKHETPPAVENNYSEWGIRPQLGKAIANNKIFGVFFDFAGSKQEYPYFSTQADMQKLENSSSGGGFFFRQYFSLNSRIYLFGEGNAGIEFSKSESSFNEIQTNERKSVTLGLGITPGLSFAATRKLHLELAMADLLAVAFSSSELKDFNAAGTLTRSAKETAFAAKANANAFSQLAVGLRWILPSKK